MKMTRTAAVTILSVVLLLLSGCATTERSLQEKGLKPLTNGQISELFSRTRNFRFTTATNASGAGTFVQNGKVSVAWQTGSADGTWRIHDNTLCTEYPTLHSGAERCFSVYRTQRNEYEMFLANGSLNSTLKFTN